MSRSVINLKFIKFKMDMSRITSYKKDDIGSKVWQHAVLFPTLYLRIKAHTDIDNTYIYI